MSRKKSDSALYGVKKLVGSFTTEAHNLLFFFVSSKKI